MSLICHSRFSDQPASRFPGKFPIAILLASLFFIATPGSAQGIAQQLMGGGKKPHIDAGGYFMMVVPGGFNCEATPRNLKCRGTRGANVLLHIEVRDVPRSATPALVLLNQMDAFKKKPHFKKVDQKKVVVDGSPGVVASFTYDYLGNVRYGVGVQALYVIRENKLFLIHFEARKRDFRSYLDDVKAVYASFRMADLDAGGNPSLKSLKIKKDPNAPPDPFKLNYGF
ncbi:MAG: hypothetical protein GY822_11745 [Deltaproteobacteria bacterium]|nr:hypothetical protein [Deltaproteobacteria bacterium]